MTDPEIDIPRLFDVETPLGFRVHCYEDYWQDKVVAQHPVMLDRVEDVKRALSNPEEVRLSRTDEEVYLFYTADDKRLVCAVARSIEDDGFLITAYPTDKMKAGKTVWKK
ncbi:MAG: DUF4258 domain-containing protein [Anaerolineae bacterium]|nr:DUF4258 domain-containing protein [Anaerolineae bacterium]